jgi:Peptidase A4 family
MRRTWRLPVAAIALAGGSLLASTGPAGAAQASPAAAAQGGPAAAAQASQAGASQAGQAGSGHSHGLVTSAGIAGYAVLRKVNNITKVSAQWKQPVAHCTASTDSTTGFWVSVGGGSNGAGYQSGTASGCNGKTPVYYAWHDRYPGQPVKFPQTVHAGDEIEVSYAYTTHNQFDITVQDKTQGWGADTVTTLPANYRSSAAIVAEPVGGAKSAGFTQVSYSDAGVNNTALCDAIPTKVTSAGLTVSALTQSKCAAFSVTASSG